MACRMELTYDDIIDTHDAKCIVAKTTGHTLPVGIFEISDFNLMVKSLIPDEVKVEIVSDEIRLSSDLTNSESKKTTEESFFYTILRFTQSHSRPSDDPSEGCIQKVPVSKKVKIQLTLSDRQKVFQM